MLKIYLSEGTHYDSDAAKILAGAGIWDLETSKRIIDLLHKKCPKINPATGEVVIDPASGEPETEGPDIPIFAHTEFKWLPKYLKGIARMIVDAAGGNRQRASEFIEDSVNNFNKYLKWLTEDDDGTGTNRDKLGGSNFDSEFMNGKIPYEDVVKKVEEIQSEDEAQSAEELANMEFNGLSSFELVPIDSFNQMHELYGGKWTGDGTDTNGTYAGHSGTAWCHANDPSKSSYEHYLRQAGKGSKYFVLQNKNFKNIPFNAETNYTEKGKDDYGNSLIALVVDRKGKLQYATLRCNHVWGDQKMGLSAPDNQYTKYSELSALAGFNVEEAVKQYMNVEADGVLLIQGTRCEGFIDEDDADTEETIEIPEGVTTIAKQAFAMCDNLTAVKFPKSLQIIEADAFYACTELVDVDTLHQTQVGMIGAGAFYQCTSLEKVVLPDTIEVIRKKAFAKCSRLQNFIIKNSDVPGVDVKIINNAFMGTPVEEQVEAKFGFAESV